MSSPISLRGAWAAAFFLAACGADPNGDGLTLPSVDVKADAGADAAAEPAKPFVPTCETDNAYCDDQPSATQETLPGCGNDPVSLTQSGVNVMLAIDGSYAMRAHWATVQAALKRLVENNPTLDYGAHLFWANPSNLDMLVDKVNFCGTTENRVLNVGKGQQTGVLPFLGPRPPGPGNQFFSLRPVIDPLNYYLQNDTPLSDPTKTNYLVVVSNGDDNCFGTAFAGDGDKLLTYEKLGIELLKKNIRVLPIGFDGATAQRTFTGKLRTDFAALDRLAKFGGTGLEKALAADSTEELEQAINQVSQAVRSCRYRVPDVLDPTKSLNPFQLIFTVNGKSVPRDRKQLDGWNFVNGKTEEIEIFGPACTAVQAGKPVDARKACNTDEICGTAATRVTTKARAVQYLFDRSLSMASCSKDATECLFNGALSWWGLATRSIAKSVVSTVNDDAEFGLQYFPGATTGACEVSPQAEVPPGDSAEITIIGSMLSNLPLGSTPLVGALEQVAQTPGRIGEAGVTGAVIVLSDGGNSCDGLTSAQAATRLGAAARTLHDRGIKVFAIRFGPKDASFTEQDEQLRAIVTNGGTAIMDPMHPDAPPYLDAPDEATLNTVLQSVSESLAACAFDLGDVPKDADKEKVNLYINGTAVPRDTSGEKKDGWAFSNPEATSIEMFGPACTEFKNSRATSLVVEFGCQSIVLR
jgi:hypothetical protein